MHGHDVLVYFMAGVFVTAGTGRLLSPDARADERRRLYPELPAEVEWLIAASELVLAAGLLLPQYRQAALLVALLGMSAFTALVMLRDMRALRETFRDVLTFKSTATCAVLHVTYIIILLALVQQRYG